MKITFDKVEQAPASGWILAYFKGGVVFGTYVRREQEIDCEGLDRYAIEDLLELHLFDEKSEYRMIRSDLSGVIEAVLSDSEILGNDSYEEKMLIYGDEIHRESRLIVKNYISYDENDMIRISNFRFAGVQQRG